MSLFNPASKTQKASDLINLDTYTRGEHLVVSKAEGDKTYVGRAYWMRPLLGGGSEFATVVKNVFKTLPDDSVIQISEICQPDVNLPHVFKQGKTHGGEVVGQLIEQQAQLLAKAVQTPLSGNMPLVNQRYLLVSLATPVQYVDAGVLQNCQYIQNEFLTGMRGSGFYDAQVLSAGALLGYYRVFADIYTPHNTLNLDELVELKHQAFTPDMDLDFRERRVGRIGQDVYCSAVTIKSYPEEVSQGLMNFAIGAPFNKEQTKDGGGHRIACPYIFNVSIRVANQRKELERIGNAIKSRTKGEELPFKLGNEEPKAALNDLQHLQMQCGKSDADKIVYVSTTAFLFGRTRKDAETSASDLKTHLGNLEFDARVCNNDTLVRWSQSLPLNFAPGIADKLGGEAIMDSAAAGCLLPIYGEHPGNADLSAGSSITGAVFLTRRGSPLFFDPYQTRTNANGLISAVSGSGKSTLLQYSIEIDLAQGTNVFLIDNGNASKKFCKAVGGEFNDLSFNTRTPPSLNPFSGLTEEEFWEEREGIAKLLLLMCYEGEPVQPGANIAMIEAVDAAYNQKQFNTEIQTVVDSLTVIFEGQDKRNLTEVQSAARNLVPRLRAFIDSPTRGKFFKGRGTIDRTKQFTVFELSGLDGDRHLQRCVIFLIMNTLMTRIKNTPGRKKIYIDEAFDLLKIDTVADALTAIYLKGRKYSVSIWIIVQSLLSLLTIKAGLVIVGQSAWKCILSQSKGEISAALSIESKPFADHQADPYFVKMLESVHTEPDVYSEMMLISEDFYEVVRLYVDRFTGVMFSTKGPAFDSILAKMEEGMGAIEAVNKFIGDKRASNKAFISDFLDVLRMQSFTNAEIMDELSKALES